MDGPDPRISNGTCYWKADSQAGDDFLPCGNAALGKHFPCCSVGDNCLANNACYDASCRSPQLSDISSCSLVFTVGTTYVAGCTDSDYSDSMCPFKGEYDDQEWVGLVNCNASLDISDEINIWVGCHEPDEDHLVPHEKDCQCDDTKTPLFTGYSLLESTAQIPQTSGGTISYFITRATTSTLVSSDRGTSSTRTSTATRFATTLIPTVLTQSPAAPTSNAATSNPTMMNATDSGLSSGAKAGIGAGITLGAIAVGGLAFLAFMLYRRHRKEDKPAPQIDDPSPAQSTPPREDSNTTYSGLSGYKAELAANSTPASAGEIVSPLSPTVPQFPGQQQQYQAYNPDIHGGNHSRYSVRSDISSVSPGPGTILPVSPQTTGTTQRHPNADGGGVTPTHPSMDAIAELEG